MPLRFVCGYCDASTDRKVEKFKDWYRSWVAWRAKNDLQNSQLPSFTHYNYDLKYNFAYHAFHKISSSFHLIISRIYVMKMNDYNYFLETDHLFWWSWTIVDSIYHLSWILTPILFSFSTVSELVNFLISPSVQDPTNSLPSSISEFFVLKNVRSGRTFLEDIYVVDVEK